MRWYLRFYIFNNLPDDTDAIGPRTTQQDFKPRIDKHFLWKELKKTVNMLGFVITMQLFYWAQRHPQITHESNDYGCTQIKLRQLYINFMQLSYIWKTLRWGIFLFCNLKNVKTAFSLWPYKNSLCQMCLEGRSCYYLTESSLAL